MVFDPVILLGVNDFFSPAPYLAHGYGGAWDLCVVWEFGDLSFVVAIRTASRFDASCVLVWDGDGSTAVAAGKEGREGEKSFHGVTR